MFKYLLKSTSKRRLDAEQALKNVNPSIMQNKNLFPSGSLKSCDEEFLEENLDTDLDEYGYINGITNENGVNAMIEVIQYYVKAGCIDSEKKKLSKKLSDYLYSIKEEIKKYPTQDNRNTSSTLKNSIVEYDVVEPSAPPLSTLPQTSSVSETYNTPPLPKSSTLPQTRSVGTMTPRKMTSIIEHVSNNQTHLQTSNASTGGSSFATVPMNTSEFNKQQNKLSSNRQQQKKR